MFLNGGDANLLINQARTFNPNVAVKLIKRRLSYDRFNKYRHTRSTA